MVKAKKSSSSSDNSVTISDVKVDNSMGPSLFNRDENGLLKNIQYTFNEDGSVNWRAMIKEEHLFPNKAWFEARNKDMPRSIDGLKDHQLLIKLSGIKELARLRGFSSVSYSMDKCEDDHVAVTCKVSFIPNYETGSSEVSFQDMANASTKNTSSFATKFLETIACNRSFVRCVRNFLNVHIVGDDEMDKSNTGSFSNSTSTSGTKGDPFSPHTTLKNRAKSVLGIETFKDFKPFIKNLWRDKKEGIYQNPEIENWKDWENISIKDTKILISYIV